MANPLGCAAGLATLETLRDMGPQAYADTHARGARLMEGLQSALDGAGLLASVIGHPTCFDVMFGVGAPADGERHAPSETITHDKETKLRFNDFLLERGVHILDVSSAFGCSFSAELVLV